MEANPLTAHLLEWFLDLSAYRSYTVIAGMGGGASIPNPVSHQELLAWGELTRNRPTLWEVTVLKKMDQSWRAASGEKSKGAPSGPKHQVLGEYCKGESVEECRKQWGAALETVCATCPN